MRDAVLGLLPNADAVVMAAAVADYRPIETMERKIKKRDAGKELSLRMTENPDILKAIVGARRAGAVVVGFKAETGDATAEAGRMLREKKLDLVVANDVSEPGSVFRVRHRPRDLRERRWGRGSATAREDGGRAAPHREARRAARALRAHRLREIEEAIRVVLRLDLPEPRVVRAPVRVFPVGEIGVGVVDVCAGTDERTHRRV